MGTSKHVAILLTVALAGLLTAGQDQPAPSQAAPLEPSNTRSASCIVRITVDPAILPLNEETVDSLIHSPAVLFKAGRDVLSLDTPEDFYRLMKPQDPDRPLLSIRWLNPSSTPGLSAAKLSPQEELARQMEEIYGRDYTQQMTMGRPVEKKDGAEEGRSGISGAGADGGMGLSSAAAPVPEQPTELRQAPGESDVAYRTRMAQVQAVRAALARQQQARAKARLPGESDVAYRARVAQIRAQEQALQEMQSRSMGSAGGGTGGYGANGIGMGGMGGYGGTGTGGMGGMMGGMGVTMGGIGGKGGMMGGYGGMGYYGSPGAPQQDAHVMQSTTIELQVNLLDTVPPRADEFLKSVVKNLQDTLSRAHESCVTDVERTLAVAKAQHENVERELEGRADEVAAVRRQLETEVDLSALTPGTSLSDAVGVLRRSVEPPLNLVVLWKDVMAEADGVEPNIDIDGLPKVRLGTALDLLVKGLRAGKVNLTWRIKDGVIVIGTTATLGLPQGWAGQPQVETDARNLAGQRSELTRRIQSLELDLAGLDARREAIGVQINAVREQVAKALARDPVARELEKLTQVYSKNVGDTGGRVYSEPVETKEKTIRARIELANREDELRKQAGGGQLEEYNKELSRMAIDKAEKEAQLQIVRRQLDEVQRQLAQALAFDPETTRLRLAQESLDITARRVAELQTRLTNLQPPMATVIGAN
jgi:hypothetical protein